MKTIHITYTMKDGTEKKTSRTGFSDGIEATQREIAEAMTNDSGSTTIESTRNKAIPSYERETFFTTIRNSDIDYITYTIEG